MKMAEPNSETDDVFLENLVQQTNENELENGVSESLNTSDIFNTEQINTNELEENTPQDSSNQKQKNLRLPFARIKHIMKLDPDCTIISQDSLFLVTKATEMFLEFIAKESGKQMGSSKRKTVMRRDVDLAIENCGNLCFLDGALD